MITFKIKSSRLPGYLIAFLLAVMILHTGCKKYLEAKSDDSLVVPVTLTDLQALLDNSGPVNSQAPSFAQASSDEYFLPLTRYNALLAEQASRYIWKPADYRFSNDWSFSYTAIYPANICLERMDNIPVTLTTLAAWNNVKGSALFYRAYYFHQLATVYAKAWDETTADIDLGIVLRTTSDINVPSVRASVEQTYEQILADTKTAAVLLPDNPPHPFRPSKAAAYGLLARAYLSMRMYDSAGKYATAALQIKNALMDYNDPAQVNLNGSQPFTAYNAEVVFHTQMNSWNNFVRAQSGALIDTALLLLYQPEDLRLKAFFQVSGTYKSFKGNYAANNNSFFSGIATDELWLIQSECEARAGNLSQALASLEALRVKRFPPAAYIPVMIASPAELVQYILLERRRELVMRGIRWGDIKRLNKEANPITLTRKVGADTYTLAPNDKRYALPIPIDIIETTNIPQN